MTDERMTAEQHADNLDAWADRLAHKEPTGELIDAARFITYEPEKMETNE